MTPAFSHAPVFAAHGGEAVVPGAGFALVGLVLVGWVALFLAALISIIASPHTAGMKLVWLIVAFAAPFLGSLLWFVIGRGDAYRRRHP